jgi:hypothetical protein
MCSVRQNISNVFENALPTREDLVEIGSSLLDHSRHPIERWRIIKDVLCLPEDDPDHICAHDAIANSKWVKELDATQHPDGSWGRFHSRDSQIKQLFPTTELALRRAINLGLDQNTPLLRKTKGYLLSILDRKTEWGDPPEKHEGWPVNIRSISMATLALLDQQNNRIEDEATRWSEIVKLTFSSGSYSAWDERAAHLVLNGIKTKGKYLKLASLYPLILLSTPYSTLPSELEIRFLDWVWHKQDGVYYVYGRCLADPPDPRSAHFIDWIRALGLLTRFKAGHRIATPAILKLWQMKDERNLWDFGASCKNGYELPLAEEWKQPLDRRIDCSLIVLSLLRQMVNAEEKRLSQ